MLPQAPAPEKPPETEYDRRRKPLQWLADEVNSMSATANVMMDQYTPYVNVNVPRTLGYRVTMTMRDGRHVYQWSGWDITHPVADPAGAARRIVIALQKERADNEADRHEAVGL